MLLFLPALLLVVIPSVCSRPLLQGTVANPPLRPFGGRDNDTDEKSPTMVGYGVFDPTLEEGVTNGQRQNNSSDAAILNVTSTAHGGYTSSTDNNGNDSGKSSPSSNLSTNSLVVTIGTRLDATSPAVIATNAVTSASRSMHWALSGEPVSETTVAGVSLTDVAVSLSSTLTAAPPSGGSVLTDTTDLLVTLETAPTAENGSTANSTDGGDSSPSSSSVTAVDTILWTTSNATETIDTNTTAATTPNSAEFNLVLVASLVPVAGVFALLLFVAVVCTAARKRRRRRP